MGPARRGAAERGRCGPGRGQPPPPLDGLASPSWPSVLISHGPLGRPQLPRLQRGRRRRSPGEPLGGAEGEPHTPAHVSRSARSGPGASESGLRGRRCPRPRAGHGAVALGPGCRRTCAAPRAARRLSAPRGAWGAGPLTRWGGRQAASPHTPLRGSHGCAKFTPSQGPGCGDTESRDANLLGDAQVPSGSQLRAPPPSGTVAPPSKSPCAARLPSGGGKDLPSPSGLCRLPWRDGDRGAGQWQRCRRRNSRSPASPRCAPRSSQRGLSGALLAQVPLSSRRDSPPSLVTDRRAANGEARLSLIYIGPPPSFTRPLPGGVAGAVRRIPVRGEESEAPGSREVASGEVAPVRNDLITSPAGAFLVYERTKRLNKIEIRCGVKAACTEEAQSGDRFPIPSCGAGVRARERTRGSPRQLLRTGPPPSRSRSQTGRREGHGGACRAVRGRRPNRSPYLSVWTWVWLLKLCRLRPADRGRNQAVSIEKPRPLPQGRGCNAPPVCSLTLRFNVLKRNRRQVHEARHLHVEARWQS